MTICEFPGCVATALDGKTVCFAHGSGLGKPCELCNGKGGRFYSKQNAIMPCLWCGGTGLKDSSKRAIKPEVVPVDERGLIALAGEPAPGPDALTLLEAENSGR